MKNNSFKDNTDNQALDRNDESRILREVEEYVFAQEKEEQHEGELQSRRSGLIFPGFLMVMVIASAYLAVRFMPYFFDTETIVFSSAESRTTSAEGEVLKAFREEAEKQIKEKDSQIENYKTRISDYDKRINSLKNLITMRAGNPSGEPAETTYGEYSGMSIEELGKQLEDMEREKQQASMMLEAESRKREEIAAELERRETELASAASDEAKSALEELAEYHSLLEKQNIVQDQLLTLQRQLLDNVDRKRYEHAYENLDAIKNIVSLREFEKYPYLSKRKDIELNTIRFLEDYLEVIRENENYTSRITPRVMYNIDSAMEAIQYGNVHYESGNYENAKRFYREGLKYIPFINTADTNLREIERLTEKDSLSGSGVSSTGDETPGSGEESRDYKEIESEILLFGLVALIEDNEITIEPFSRKKVEEGKKFLIKKRSGGAETEIAQGIITEAGDFSVRGSILKQKDPEQGVSVNNTVYLY